MTLRRMGIYANSVISEMLVTKIINLKKKEDKKNPKKQNQNKQQQTNVLLKIKIPR